MKSVNITKMGYNGGAIQLYDSSTSGLVCLKVKPYGRYSIVWLNKGEAEQIYNALKEKFSFSNKETPMRKLPTKSQVLEAAKRCPQAKEALETLFPGDFEEEKPPLGLLKNGIFCGYSQKYKKYIIYGADGKIIPNEETKSEYIESLDQLRRQLKTLNAI